MPDYNLTTSHFGDDGFIIHPTVGGTDVTEAAITDRDGVAHSIEGFDYASHLLGDAIVCTCGEHIDAHQIALYTKKREYIIIPARCCKKFRWFRSDEI